MTEQVPINLNDENAYYIEFQNPKGGSLGRFTFMKDRCEFEGAADECARQFIDEVKKLWQVQQLKP